MAARAGPDCTAQNSGSILSGVHHVQGSSRGSGCCYSFRRQFRRPLKCACYSGVATRVDRRSRSERTVALLLVPLLFVAVKTGAIAWCAVVALWYIVLFSYGLSGTGLRKIILYSRAPGSFPYPGYLKADCPEDRPSALRSLFEISKEARGGFQNPLTGR